MAIFHLSVKIISRSSGRSAIAAAAYRAGEKLKNDEKGGKATSTSLASCASSLFSTS